MELKLANRSIFDSLEEALSKRELIVTNERQRKIGKTTALMLFAERKNLPVIVQQIMKRDYSKKYPNVQIFGHKEVVNRDGLPLTVLCDEGVPKETIEFLRGLRIEVSGFLFESFTEENPFSPFVVANDAITYISSKYGVDVAIPEKDLSSLTVQQIKEPPLLQIELDNLRSVPRVFYKGEEIMNKVRVDFSYLTGDEYGSKPIYIDIVTRREDGTARGIIHNQGAIGIDERRL